MESTDLVPTLGSMLGFSTALAQGKPISGTILNSMLPADLKPEHFNGYPPEAKKLVTNYLSALQRLPMSFLPVFCAKSSNTISNSPPTTRAAEGTAESPLSLAGPDQGLAARLRAIHLSSQLEHFDWVNSPAQFVEQLSSYLWTTHQLDAFRTAALRRLMPSAMRRGSAGRRLRTARLGIVVVGEGWKLPNELPAFRKIASGRASISLHK